MLKQDAAAIGIRRLFAPTDEADIADAERRIGRPIPAPYRAFLLVHNGGFPTPDGFVVPDGGASNERGEQGQVKHFLGVNTGTRVTDLAVRFEMYRGRVPDALLPIAIDMGGNVIALATSGSDAGAVYLWDHEAPPQDSSAPPFGRATRLAPTLDAFLAGLADIEA